MRNLSTRLAAVVLAGLMASAALASSIVSTTGTATYPKFTQGGTGAVARNVTEKEGDFLSVKDFNTKGDGTSDDTAPIQNAISYAQTAGKSLYFPAGSYMTTATLNITKPLVIKMDGTILPNFTGFAFTVNQASAQKLTVYNANIKWYGSFGASTAGGFDLQNTGMVTFVDPHIWGLGKSAWQVSAPGVVGLTIIRPYVQEHVGGDIITTSGNPNITIFQIIGGMLQYTASAAHNYDAVSFKGSGEQDTFTVTGTAFENCKNGISAYNLRQFKVTSGYFEACTNGIVLGSGWSTNKPGDGVYMTSAGTGAIESSIFSQGTNGILLSGVVRGVRIGQNFFDNSLANSINVQTSMTSGLKLEANDDNSAGKIAGYVPVVAGSSIVNYDKTIIDPANALTGWTKSFDPTATGALSLASGWDNKNQAIQLQVTGDQVVAAKTLTANLSAYDYFIVPLYITDRSTMAPPTSYTDPSVYSGSAVKFFTDGSNYASFYLSQFDYGLYSTLKPGWNYVVMPKAMFKVTGTMNWGTVTSINLTAVAQAGKTTTIRYGGVFGVKLTGTMSYEGPNNLYQ